MKKKYLVVVMLLMLIGITSPKALNVDDCKVLVSFKLSSSLDEEKYICKGSSYGNNGEAIYYSGIENTIYLNNFTAYYFTNWDEYDVTIDITGQNNISLLHLSDSKFKVTGSGSLKFKQNSFVKKVINGEYVYQFVYKDKQILDQNKKIYEGTTTEFEENYELLKKYNELPLEYNFNDYELVSAVDYVKMTPVIVSETWLNKNIDTTLSKTVKNGYGIVEYIQPTKKEEKKAEVKEQSQLETENVILISEEKLENQYKLKETDLKNEDVATKVANEIDQDLISLYNVAVYNNQNEVPMKNSKYIIKIKLDQDSDAYENYQIIYIDDNDEIAEYIKGHIEGEYIVFETTHLSQYGVIATPKGSSLSVNINGTNPGIKNKINVANILKVSVLLAFIVITISLIIFIVLKSNLIHKKQTKRKRD